MLGFFLPGQDSCVLRCFSFFQLFNPFFPPHSLVPAAALSRAMGEAAESSCGCGVGHAQPVPIHAHSLTLWSHEFPVVTLCLHRQG